MSLHKSLKSYPFRSKKRSVRKRRERYNRLISSGKWDSKNNSIFKMPKEKVIKIKKIKEKEEDEKLTTTLIPPSDSEKKS